MNEYVELTLANVMAINLTVIGLAKGLEQRLLDKVEAIKVTTFFGSKLDDNLINCHCALTLNRPHI